MISVKILSKNVQIDRIGWTKLIVNENGLTQIIWINPKCVESIIYNYTEKSIKIMMNSNNFYELICENDFNAKINILEKHLIYV